ncbi:MAG: ABC transporter permease [Candidatus Thermofonsia Clade 1 bacterium]|uniref:ABC transporter permease n=1 Tax=Candidatus Thermofonsia Clade 1 bacterium TaxID=2364210 RepID=A0A2M8PB59_9CHLR|nr:MAG: ABC transporter permease [Candidatus Thermofonsia Clade 1 bacterium]RMF53081.1 MAG: carbohydrate ABC transporter permease [Chloroflexota bacterium]
MRIRAIKRLRSALGTLLLIGMAIFWLIPLIWSVLIALRPENEPIVTGNIFFGSRLTLENFQNVARVTNWGEHFYATLRFVFGVLVVQIVTITLAAYAFARMRFFGKQLLFGAILIQLMIPAAVLIVPNFATIRTLGLYDTIWALMLPYMGSAFGTFLMRQAFKQVPLELEDAARIDGCGWFGVLWHVYLPPSIPSLVAFGLVSVTTRWNEFLWPMIVTQSSENRPLTVGLSRVLRTSEVGALYGQITAGVLVVIFPLMLLFLFFQRQFINSFVRSGLK